jgi:hypothetical protein
MLDSITKISEEVKFDRKEKFYLSLPNHPISPSVNLPQDKLSVNESIDSEKESSFLDEDDSSGEDRRRKKKKGKSSICMDLPLAICKNLTLSIVKND